MGKIMNIFFLDQDVIECSKYHSDKHVVKMILEYAQMLSTAHRVLADDTAQVPEELYKVTHVNHPCSIWTRESFANYSWLYALMINLHYEYRFRYGWDKSHKTLVKLERALANVPEALRETERHLISKPALAMPDEYKSPDGCPVKSYRAYYAMGKSESIIAFNKSRQAPEWLSEYMTRGLI
jgi:hypothetical protein